MKQPFLLLLLLALLLPGCNRDETAPERWQPVKVGNNTSRIYAMTEVHFSSPQVGWLSGGRDQSFTGHPVLLKTTDGGQSWNSIDLAALQIRACLGIG